MTRTHNKSSSLYFFKRNWHKLNPDNLQIEKIDRQRRQITYTVRDTIFRVILRKQTLLFKEINAKKQFQRQLFSFHLNDVPKPMYNLEAENRARKLVQKIVDQNPLMVYSDGSLLVSSINHKTYLITDKVFEIIGEREEFRCVDTEKYILPPSDQSLAKALVIAYRPDLIYTLNESDEL
jgi:hypothetical protein